MIWNICQRIHSKSNTMERLLLVALTFGICSTAEVAGVEPLEKFIEDIVMTWKLLSPTIILKEETLDLCRSHEMMRCVLNDANTTELAEHLSTLHNGRTQDGLILVGSSVHEKLVEQISQI